MRIAYDGTDFFGWQEQPNVPTIAQTLKNAFARIFGSEGSFVAASRTDAGVHAQGQVARFVTDFFFNPESMRIAWNNGLPSSIHIIDMRLAPKNFHPWHNIAYKIYRYHFFLERPLPVFARYGWHYTYCIDEQKLANVLALFVGMHNFRAFVTDPGEKNTHLTIDAITVTYNESMHAYCIEVRGKKFLQHMIRRIIGASLYAARINTAISLNNIVQIRDVQDVYHCLPTAPAQGLTLHEVVYME